MDDQLMNHLDDKQDQLSNFKSEINNQDEYLILR